MKRHPSLHPLSEHHHHALVQALEIARAAKAPGPDRPARLRQAAQSLLHFWEIAGRIHFREEEDILLPALARHVRLDQEPAGLTLVYRKAMHRAAERCALPDSGTARRETRARSGRQQTISRQAKEEQ